MKGGAYKTFGRREPGLMNDNGEEKAGSKDSKAWDRMRLAAEEALDGVPPRVGKLPISASWVREQEGRGYSHAQVAQALGVSRELIRLVLRENREPPPPRP